MLRLGQVERATLGLDLKTVPLAGLDVGQEGRDLGRRVGDRAVVAIDGAREGEAAAVAALSDFDARAAAALRAERSHVSSPLLGGHSPWSILPVGVLSLGSFGISSGSPWARAKSFMAIEMSAPCTVAGSFGPTMSGCTATRSVYDSSTRPSAMSVTLLCRVRIT